MIQRAARKHNYANINQVPIDDPNLSWEALGMLAYLLSKPDYWEANTDHLWNYRSAGRDKVLRIQKELEDARYLRRVKYRDIKGRWQWKKVVYDEPQPVKPQAEMPITGKPVDGKPVEGKPVEGFSGVITTTELVKDNNNNSFKDNSYNDGPCPENQQAENNGNGFYFDAGEDAAQTAVSQWCRYFTEKTMLLPNGNIDLWDKPMQSIIDKSDGDDEIKARIDYALSAASGNNSRGKKYNITSPKSILAFALNWEPDQEVFDRDAVQEAQEVFDGILQSMQLYGQYEPTKWAVVANKDSNPLAYTAFRAVGGVDGFCMANKDLIKEKFIAAYHGLKD